MNYNRSQIYLYNNLLHFFISSALKKDQIPSFHIINYQKDKSANFVGIRITNICKFNYTRKLLF